jgi:3',5'-cyclic AMP phosphodiesterase CpdA
MLMKLYAISDLHVGCGENYSALAGIRPRPNDWLILAGDIGETEEHLEFTLASLAPRFAKLLWCPGNHELWTIGAHGARGQAKYEQLVAICRKHGVLTPEDDYVVWEGQGGRHLLVPMFLLYDYTFRPDHVAPERAVEWAAQAGLRCADEELLDPTPYPSRAAWCAARCDWTEQRLERALREHDLPTILINHFPLKQALARLPAIPRFKIWCGTRRTEDWAARFRASVAVSGHLHIRRTEYVDRTRFEEVSVGYPHRQWRVAQGIDHHLREILPGPAA